VEKSKFGGANSVFWGRNNSPKAGGAHYSDSTIRRAEQPEKRERVSRSRRLAPRCKYRDLTYIY
jgi:hypothetical protein